MNLLCQASFHKWDGCKCVKCGKVRNEEHNWGDWSYISNNQCTQKRSCIICDKEESGINHDWGEWKYVEEGKCVQKRFCLKDGTINERKKHRKVSITALYGGRIAIGPEEFNQSDDQYDCRHCGELDVPFTDT